MPCETGPQTSPSQPNPSFLQDRPRPTSPSADRDGEGTGSQVFGDLPAQYGHSTEGKKKQGPVAGMLRAVGN